MPKRIFIGNVPQDYSERQIRELVSSFGEVGVIELELNDAGRFTGNCIVNMPDDRQAGDAIAALNGRREGALSLNVNEARPRTD